MNGQRASARSEIRLSCPCRLSDGVPLELDLRDVSPRGCRVKIGSLPLYIGQSMTIFPEGLDEFTGTVRRADDDFAGVEFDRELPHPVFERLRCNYAAKEEPAEQTPEAETSVEPDERDTPTEVSIEKPRRKAQYGSLAALSPTRGKRSFGTKGVTLS